MFSSINYVCKTRVGIMNNSQKIIFIVLIKVNKVQMPANILKNGTKVLY